MSAWRQIWPTVGLLLPLAMFLCSCADKAPTVGDLSDFEPGIAYTNQNLPKVPWSLHVVRLDRAEADFQFHTMHAQGRATGLGTLTDQIVSLKPELGSPLVGINGDFYAFAGRRPCTGDPRGLQILEGQLISAPCGGPVFWMDAAGQPHATNVQSLFRVTWPDGSQSPFGLDERRLSNSVVLFTSNVGRSTHTTKGTELVLERLGPGAWFPLHVGDTFEARVIDICPNGRTEITSNMMVLSIDPFQTNSPPSVATGAVLRLELATDPDLKGIQTAIGGGPLLVHEGLRQKLKKPKGDQGVAYEYRSMWERHPRTALGWNDRYFFFVLVDGRQKQLSKGMKLDTLADYMIGLGCREVLNFDGGGSSTLWCNGTVANSPCDGWEREIANALIVVRKNSNDPALQSSLRNEGTAPLEPASK